MLDFTESDPLRFLSRRIQLSTPTLPQTHERSVRVIHSCSLRHGEGAEATDEERNEERGEERKDVGNK
jgi:hypothetical protein